MFAYFLGAVFCGVMPKIIRILELLESLVTKKEEEAAEIVELNDSLHKLQVESQLKDRKKQEVQINILQLSSICTLNSKIVI